MTEPCTPPSAVRTRDDEPPGTLFKLQRRREALEFQGDRIDRILRMHDRKRQSSDTIAPACFSTRGVLCW